MRRGLEDNGAGWLVAMFSPIVSFGNAWDKSTQELTASDESDGWGLGVRLGDIAGFRWDEATIPQASSLSKVQREGLTAFVDVVALTAALR